jgi:hypothetical protein
MVKKLNKKKMKIQLKPKEIKEIREKGKKTIRKESEEDREIQKAISLM